MLTVERNHFISCFVVALTHFIVKLTLYQYHVLMKL